MKNLNVTIHECDYSNVDDLKNVGRMINSYIEDEMGGGTPLIQIQTLQLVNALNEHPKSIVLLAEIENNCCGLLIAFENISTFTVSPMLNIHDVIVSKEYRKKGVGRSLMESLVTIAQSRGCSRITLEVREDNLAAQQLYKSMEFGESDPPMLYWRKYLK